MRKLLIFVVATVRQLSPP